MKADKWEGKVPQQTRKYREVIERNQAKQTMGKHKSREKILPDCKQPRADLQKPTKSACWQSR